MMKIRTIILLIVVISIAACSDNRGRVVAEVNGHPIYTSDVADMMQLERTKYDEVLVSMPDNAKKLRRAALETLIEEALLLDEAKKYEISATKNEGFSTSDMDEIEPMLEKRGIDPEFWFQQQRRKLLIKKLILQEVINKIPVSEEDILSYYTANRNKFSRPLQYRARQILVDSREKADEIAKRLKAGEKFDELAKEYSVSPDAERGGDLGYFSTKDFPRVFSEICAQLKIGEISKVKETDYGFQIFQLLDKSRAKTLPLKEVRSEIIERIRDESSAEVLAQWFSDIRARGRIMINEEALEEVKLHAFANNK